MSNTQAYYQSGNLTYRDAVNSPYRGQAPLANLDLIVANNDPVGYFFKREDFDYTTVSANAVGGWTTTTATSGSIAADTTHPNGVINISAGAATANQGVNFQLIQSPLQIRTGKPVVFECGFNFTGLTTLAFQSFIGLAAQSTALIASGAMAAVQRIGFQGISTSTGVINSVAKAAGTAVTGTGLSLVNATQYRLAIVASATSIVFYVNGLAVSTITSQIPTGVLAPSFVVQANGSSITPVLNLDWVAYGQAR